jgi:periplasmic protein TonB
MFEHSLFDLETADLESKTQPRRRRWLSLPLAIGLHLVALTAFAFASYWNVGTVADPDLNMAAFVVMLPPPEIQQGGGPRPHPVPTPPRPTPTPAPTPTTLHQPDPTTAPDKPVDAPDPITQQDPGPVLTDDPAVPPGPGDPHGDRNSRNPVGPIVPGPAPVGDGLPTYLTAEMSRPVPLRPILPRYTEPARRAGLQGTVVVEAIIDEQGRATDVRILRGLPMGLDRAAVEAIQQVTFKPAMIGNRPVKVYFTLTVNFAIQR